MSLPCGYSIEKRGNLLHLYREVTGEVYAAVDRGAARESLEEVARFHEVERVAWVESIKARRGSEEQRRWRLIGEEAEERKRQAMIEASGVREWR